MKKKIYVQGMHCVSCEKILEDELGKVPFVKNVAADCKRGEVEIGFGSKEPNSAAIKEIIEKVGYKASEAPFEKNEKRSFRLSDWLSGVLIALIVLFLIRFIQNSGLMPSVGVNSLGAGIGVGVLIGLAASLSSCLAVVGGVIIAFSEKFQSKETDFWGSSVWPNLSFHIGRLVTFFVLGGLLGLIGSEINISGRFLSFYTIFISVIMFLLALNILGLAPSITNLGVSMPKIFTRRWGALKDSNHKAAPFILGGLSFFLPCGFTQSMQLFALASGSFWTGGLVLLFFALGTLPVLFALGVATSWTKSRHLVIFQKAAGILVLVFSFYTLFSGWAIRGVQGDIFSSNNIAGVSGGKERGDVISDRQNDSESQVVRTDLSSSGFSPNVIKIKKGVPVKWVINGDRADGCTDKIIIPSLNITKAINPGENVVTFTPKERGEIPFSCWMGMVRGKFIVE